MHVEYASSFGWITSVAAVTHFLQGSTVLLTMWRHVSISQGRWNDFADHVVENAREVILLHHFLLIFDDIIPPTHARPPPAHTHKQA